MQGNITKGVKENLESQGYRMVGNHSTVKTCGWTRKMIRGDGGCYKLKFYGIMSNQCLQMSTSISCASRCVFCWRGYKAPVSKKWKGDIDDPEMIIDKAIKTQSDLLMGFNGNPNINRPLYEASKTPKHVALSLTGEPITYPRINEAIEGFHKRGISTFMVTNAQYVDEIKNLAPVTQFYLSVDAPNKELLKKIDNPLFDDYWERMIGSLDAMAEKQHRTCIRLTMISDGNTMGNMIFPEQYAELIKRGDPDFIEAKGYMFIGASRQRLDIKNMPLHEEVVEFSKELLKHLPEYELVSEHIPSRVVMLAKKKFKKDDGKGNVVWHTWIDFDKFFTLTDPKTDDYMKKTPPDFIGISGRGTLDNMSEARKKQVLKDHGHAPDKFDPYKVNEVDEELDVQKEE